ncbi:conserved hypothetical protein [Leishmania major strain Friedlin]|uniref:SET domain-containing protein n=1 Tax=Leishmania major TaxID=5664 RepID=Q4Q4F8_LEIMA|nr:conserved hypothetical protein [Leishmania major strain Friedlin]CAG9580612.1 SET_domain_containing_protein_-_putative [Leishmania major strain Friedlin]CAJ06023.1 conserved hypothetical protein [Leishmania major strain Friedlin]|eukprot:XP_001685790.1 conserved hypothetical protein [Leishmania major strain Friedlin]
MPSAPLGRGPPHPFSPFNDEADDDAHEESWRLYGSTVALADCRVSTLLPSPPPQLTRSALTAVLELDCDALSGSDDRGALIDVVLSHLCAASSLPGADADACGGTERSAMAALSDTWREVKSRVPLKASPSIHLTGGHIRALLRMYAEASVELASITLLRPLTAAAEPTAGAETEMAAAVAALGAVHEILGAQQVARITASHIASVPTDQTILDRIRTLLLALLGASPLSSSRAQFYLHPHLELSIDPSRSVAGCGLVAIGTVGEGELLAREAALATVDGTEVRVFSRGDSETTSAVANTAEHMQDSTPIWKEGVRRCHSSAAAAPVAEEAANEPIARTLQRKDSAPLITENGERSAAAQLLSLLARFPDLLRGGLHQWAERVMRDAFALQSASCVQQVQVSKAAKPQAEAAPQNSPCDTNLTADAPLRRARHSRGGVAHAFLPSAPQLLLHVRGVDEFRIKPPPRSWRRKPCNEHHGCVNAGMTRGDGDCGVAACASPSASDVSVKALFPFLRHLNHACVPNAILVLDRTPTHLRRSGDDGVVASLVALRAIESGEEVTVSYVPATTALTVSQTELLETLGFRCRCLFCTQKAALLRGHVCGECGQLIYEPGIQGEPEALSSMPAAAGASKRATVFRHEEHCSHRRRACEVHGVTEEKSSAAAQLQRQLDDVLVRLAKGEDEGEAGENVRDPVVAAVRHLVDLDACVARTLLPTHFLRLRLRLEAFAYSTVARGLGSTVSAELIHLCASTLEELEMLMPANHPLLTGLRMYLVFSRGRHVRAVNAAEDLVHGTRHEECCGAVREQAALMQLPFVVDPLVRRCVVRCFQEHYVQLLRWRAEWLSRAGEVGTLMSFLARYSVELEACGVTTAEHMELLSCMEDGAEDA